MEAESNQPGAPRADYHYMKYQYKLDKEDFMKRVYVILSIQLIFTTIVAGTVMGSKRFQQWFLDNMWFLWFLIAVYFVCFLILLVWKKAARKVPINFLILGILIFSQSLLMGAIASLLDPITVFIAAVITLGAALGLTAYALFSGYNYSWHWGLLSGSTLAFICFGICMGFFFSTHIWTVFISLGCVLLFSLYLVIDTQLIAEEGKYGLTCDDYIAGSVAIYIDIFAIIFCIFNCLDKICK